VVDDDPDVRSLLARVLDAEGCAVSQASDGQQALACLSRRSPDLMLLDVMLQGENGFELLAAVRRTSDVPVIMLTGKDTEGDKVLGLRLGADDYVAKPFSTDELAARVSSVLRRSGRRAPAQPAETASTLDFGDLSIDALAREVKVLGTVIATTAREFDLLAFMARSPRQVFTRAQLLDHVWSSSSEWQDEGTVTEHVRRIRHKVERDPEHPRWIQTVRGVGYRFEP
jgi:two-component system, OmpR family, phosphate regulon response regulator PhoB